LEGAAPRQPGIWADLGCGDGTFTEALVEILGPGSRIYAVDRDRQAVKDLQRRLADNPNVVPIVADFTRSLELPGIQSGRLDGILLANSLHYVRDPVPVLTHLARLLRPEGRVIAIEYDRRGANPWVPFPISIMRFEALAKSAGLSVPVITARRPSRFGGDLYVAVSTRASE
jgi:ubiquinone/menaquinone biosynthesis C-methylase UbiE